MWVKMLQNTAVQVNAVGDTLVTSREGAGGGNLPSLLLFILSLETRKSSSYNTRSALRPKRGFPWLQLPLLSGKSGFKDMT